MIRKFPLFILMLFACINIALAQNTTVKGKVSDGKGVGLPGVTVKVNGANTTTITDIDGNYSVSAAANSEITFSMVGFTTQTEKVGAGGVLNVSLTESIGNLNEVVVVGYGTQKKSVVTGAISGVRAADLENQPVNRIEQSLQGRTSGLTVSSASGQPGAASTVRLRGFTSFGSGTNDPLWVVDGVIVDNGGIGYLNQSDIESVEVLKDAASAAIYGTRAASGVILVTTKKGKAGTLNINYSGYYGTQAPAKKLDLLNATQYATLRNQALVNAGKAALFPNPSSFGAGTDWQSLIFDNSAPKQNHEFSVNGGSDKATYFASFGYNDIRGVVASPIAKWNRANIRINTTFKPAKWITFGENVGYSHTVSSGVGETNREFGGVLSSAINLDPITPAYVNDPVAQAAFVGPNAASKAAQTKAPDGRYYGVSPYVLQEMKNPLAYIQNHLGNYNWDHNIVGNAFLDLEPIAGLHIHSTLGTKTAFYGNDAFTPIAFYNTATTINKSSFARNENYIINWNIENTVSYNKAFGKHNVTLLVGEGEYKDGNARGLTVTYQNIPATTFNQASFNFNALPADRISSGSDGTDHRINSLFSRLQYNYDEKYLLTALVRRDGSSRFGSNYHYGSFPSVSVGWVPTRESFFPKTDVIELLKVRASYGVTGNDAGIKDFAFSSTVDAGGNRNYIFGTGEVVNIGYSPAAPANPNLRWEQTSQLDFGIDAVFLQNFTFTADVYNKKTSGILQYPFIPAYTGYYGSFAQNAADMENRGLELELGYRNRFGDFTFGANGNISFYKNKVTKLLPGIQFIEDNSATFQNMGNITRSGLGLPYQQYYGYKSVGIFQSQAEVDSYVGKDGVTKLQPNAKPGDLKFANLNNDNIIDANDRTYIGNPNPTVSYGLTINLAYKNFDFTAFGSGSGGNQIFQGLRRLDISSANYQTKYLNAWTPSNTSATLPRIVDGDPNGSYSKFTSLYLESGNFFKLRSVQLGYTFPKLMTSKWGMKNLRVYVLSENLFTLTKYTGYDPELGISPDAGGGGQFGIDRGAYPQARTFLVGVNVGF